MFWALVIAVVLWILCAFAGRLVNSNYRMPLFLHLLCFPVAVLSVVLLTIVFSCNKINRAGTEVDAGITKFMMTDEKFINGLQQEINQASSTKDADGEFTKGIRLKIKSVQRKTLIVFILLQAVAFGVVFYSAGKYRSPVSRSIYSYYSSDEME